MRLFLAIDLPEELKEKVIGLQKSMPFEGSKIVLVKRDALHITLKFLGEQVEDSVREIINITKSIADKTPRFEITLAGTGAFPSEDYIRVIYLSLKSEKDILVALSKMLKDSLDSFRKDTKETTPHLTIARVRQVKDKEPLKQYIQEHSKEERASFIVDSLKLYKSTLTPEGPLYELVEEFKLKG